MRVRLCCRSSNVAGSRMRLILEVDGDRIVLAWVAVPGVTRGEMNDPTDMVESTRFANSG